MGNANSEYRVANIGSITLFAKADEPLASMISKLSPFGMPVGRDFKRTWRLSLEDITIFPPRLEARIPLRVL